MSTMVPNQSKPGVTTPAITGRKVILQLQNPLLSESTLKETPSGSDGFDIETETDLRILGCEMIQTAGMLLKLPQVAMATGQMYLQRFYYSKSFARYPMEIMAMGSIYLASKVEEKPREIHDVINVFHHIKQVRAQKLITSGIIDKKFRELTDEVIRAERFLLKELGFCVHVKHPHKLLVVYLQFLKSEKNRSLVQMAFNYLSDASRTDVFMRFPQETIACACIYLAARKIGLPLPNDPHWFLLFKVTEANIRIICTCILKLYTRPKINADELERKVNDLRRIYHANKRKVASEEQNNAKTEDEKVDSPAAPTSKELNRGDEEKEKSPKTPPLSSTHHSSHKPKRERRSHSPYDRMRRKYSSKTNESRSRDREYRDRSRERRRDDNKRGGSISMKYYDYYRSKSSRDRREGRDEKRKR